MGHEVTHDFKDALSKVQGLIDFYNEHRKYYTEQQYVNIDAHISVLRTEARALKIAIALMQDPTHTVVRAGISARWEDEEPIVDTFKAMRDQMIREIDATP